MQTHYNINEKGKHLTGNDRKNIERWRLEGKPRNQIALLLGKSRGCIQNEIKRGTVSVIQTKGGYQRVTVYSAEAGQRTYEKAKQRCGAKCRLTEALRDTIESWLILRYSPYAIACKTGVPERTIYSWITANRFALKRAEALTYPQKQKIKRERPKQVRQFGESIDRRPESINQRENDFDYEIDTVLPKRGTGGVLLTLTNRKSRFELIRLIPDKSAASVNQALKEILRKHSISSITADNGTEFARLTDFKNIPIYYAHAYSSWERGSNENHNRMIRRWFPKGAPAPTPQEVAFVQNWLNNYPRHLFHGKSVLECFRTG
jgi:IS30 family transposase